MGLRHRTGRERPALPDPLVNRLPFGLGDVRVAFHRQEGQRRPELAVAGLDVDGGGGERDAGLRMHADDHLYLIGGRP